MAAALAGSRVTYSAWTTQPATKAWEPIGITFGVLAVEKKTVMLQTRGFTTSERIDRLLSVALTKLALDFKRGKVPIRTKAQQN